MSHLEIYDRRYVRTDVWTIVPGEMLDIRSPKIRSDTITKIDFFYPDRFKEEIFLSGVTGEKRCEYRIDRIDQNSMKSARLAVDVMARYFRREFSYDFVQYEANEISHSRDRIFLLTVNRYSHRLGVGAICFRWRVWRDAPPCLALAWVWINPFLRRKGILSTYWEAFRTLYGDFLCEPPLSPAMKTFLAKRNECWKCGRQCMCPNAAK